MSSNSQLLQSYGTPFSVWQLIKSIVPKEELPLIRNSIGESLIDSCIDLRCEVETLLEIWKNMKEDTSFKSKSSRLPDPPHLKDMLKSEIKLLVQSLTTQSCKVLNSSFNESDMQTISYVLQDSTVERPPTPIIKVNKSDFNTASSTPVRLKDVRRNINVQDIDRVLNILREALNKECKALGKDVGFLQDCIEVEHTSQPFVSEKLQNLQEPSLNQLKVARRNLENEVLTKCHKTKKRSTSAPTTSSKKRGKSSLVDKQFKKLVCQRTKITECWTEPTWTKSMNSSRYKSKRPETRDLNSIVERLSSACVIETPRNDTNNSKPVVKSKMIKKLESKKLLPHPPNKSKTKLGPIVKRPYIKQSLISSRLPKSTFQT